MRFLKIPEKMNGINSLNIDKSLFDSFHSESMHSCMAINADIYDVYSGLYAETNTDTIKAKMMKLSQCV